MRACAGAYIHMTASEAKTGDHASTVTAAQSARYTKQATEFEHLGGAISPDSDLSGGTVRRLQRVCRPCFLPVVQYSFEQHDHPGVRLRLKVQMLKAEITETLIYGCVPWSSSKCTLTIVQSYDRPTTSLLGTISTRTPPSSRPTGLSRQTPR